MTPSIATKSQDVNSPFYFFPLTTCFAPYRPSSVLYFIVYNNFVDLERGPLSLASTTEKLLDRKVASPVKKTENTAVGIRHADHVAPSIRKSWQSLRRQAAVARSV
jgi:hypothetical protein